MTCIPKIAKNAGTVLPLKVILSGREKPGIPAKQPVSASSGRKMLGIMAGERGDVVKQGRRRCQTGQEKMSDKAEEVVGQGMRGWRVDFVKVSRSSG